MCPSPLFFFFLFFPFSLCVCVCVCVCVLEGYQQTICRRTCWVIGCYRNSLRVSEVAACRWGCADRGAKGIAIDYISSSSRLPHSPATGGREVVGGGGRGSDALEISQRSIFLISRWLVLRYFLHCGSGLSLQACLPVDLPAPFVPVRESDYQLTSPACFVQLSFFFFFFACQSVLNHLLVDLCFLIPKCHQVLLIICLWIPVPLCQSVPNHVGCLKSIECLGSCGGW